LEAEPLDGDKPWRQRLDKEFVHARMILAAPDAAEFILSLSPKLAYALNQMWSTYAATQLGVRLYADELSPSESLSRWCSNLKTVSEQLTEGSWLKAHMRHSWTTRLLELQEMWNDVAEREDGEGAWSSKDAQ
jgi:hypothetical protein